MTKYQTYCKLIGFDEKTKLGYYDYIKHLKDFQIWLIS